MTRATRLLLTRPLAALMLVATGACSTLESINPFAEDEPQVNAVDQPPEDIYAGGLRALQTGDYDTAAEQFNELERLHPYSNYATDAQLLAAYSYYEDLEYDEAIAALERFIELHPNHPDSAYAYYLRALCYYEQIVDVERDQGVTQLAMEALEEVVTRFPGTDYARDASLKLDLAYDQLAGQEMSVGRYYLRQGHHQAAINRFRRVIDNYETTSHTPEALHRLTEAYLALGLVGEAERTATVLATNFPGSEWYQDSYALLVEGQSREPAGGSLLDPLGLFN